MNLKTKVTVLLLCILTPLTTLALSDGKSMTPQQLNTRLQKENPPIILDVRSLSEYQAGHIKTAMHTPFYKALIGLHGLQVPKDSELVLYCQHGPRAGLAKIGLRLTGYRNVQYLKGHMSGWQKLGLPVSIVTK